jgi:hypothetical protein
MSRSANSDANGPERLDGHTEPEQFPVTVVRPAATVPAALTAAQRARQRRANHLAHDITECARNAVRDDGHRDVGLPLSMHTIAEVNAAVREIIRDAPGLAAHPPAGAVRIGRDNRGRVVVVVLHAATWSLLLRPGRARPAAWTFLAAYDCELGLCLHSGRDLLLQLQWDEMLDAVLTGASRRPPLHR